MGASSFCSYLGQDLRSELRRRPSFLDRESQIGRDGLHFGHSPEADIAVVEVCLKGLSFLRLQGQEDVA